MAHPTKHACGCLGPSSLGDIRLSDLSIGLARLKRRTIKVQNYLLNILDFQALLDTFETDRSL